MSILNDFVGRYKYYKKKTSLSGFSINNLILLDNTIGLLYTARFAFYKSKLPLYQIKKILKSF